MRKKYGEYLHFDKNDVSERRAETAKECVR